MLSHANCQSYAANGMIHLKFSRGVQKVYRLVRGCGFIPLLHIMHQLVLSYVCTILNEQTYTHTHRPYISFLSSAYSQITYTHFAALFRLLLSFTRSPAIKTALWINYEKFMQRHTAKLFFCLLYVYILLFVCGCARACGSFAQPSSQPEIPACNARADTKRVQRMMKLCCDLILRAF